MTKFNIPVHIEEKPDLGKWTLNTHQKMPLIKECLVKFKHNIVWLDADAIVHSYPVLFDQIIEDFAVYSENDIKPQTGTMFFRCCKNIIEFLDRWIAKNSKMPNGSDQHNIPYLKDLSIYKLPKSYCQIFDIRNDGNSVIEHFQASRRFR